MFGLVTFVFISHVFYSASAEVPLCVGGGYQLIAKSNCRGYYLCVAGRAVEMPDCPSGSVFSSAGHVCVPENSVYDDCPRKTVPDESVEPGVGPLSIEKQCELYGGVIPHLEQCQAFYNCSVHHTFGFMSRYSEQHVQECDYPDLFNVLTKKCDRFENVQCGSRIEPKDGCDYRINQCISAHCMPCEYRFPSCVGVTDGLQPHPARLWTPYYIVCYKQRFVTKSTCVKGAGGQTLFHPTLKQCVPLDQVPQEYGGTMA